MKDGYSICFNEWALDKSIKSELGLLLIISSLTAEKGYCYASNDYFAELFGIDPVSVCRKIKKLERKGYITILYKKRGSEIISREIRLTKMLTSINKKVNGTINKNVKENITSGIITRENRENNIKEKREDETGRPVSTISHSFDWFINRWNENVSGRGCAPSIRVLTDDRKRRLKQIIPIAVKGYPDLSEEDAVFKVISNYNNSRFLKGETNERFIFNVDFVLNKRHFLKLMEGGYDDKF